MLRKISLASVGLTVGSILTVIGFIAYATGNATLNLAGLFYGVPILLGGLALKAAELKPIPFSVPTSPEIVDLREKQATPTQNQLRKDVTRYRYGQEAHLDESLEKIGLSPTDEERPELVSIRETQTEGAYTLVMEFNSPFISFSQWQEKQEKIAKFFGPNIKAAITQPEKDRIELALIRVNDD
jgi:Na+/melibiose symporter-like transporter